MKEAAIEFLETVDLASLNLDSPLPDPQPPSISSPPLLKHRTPSLPVDAADPLNALPPDTNDSALRSLTTALEGSYKLLWNKVQLPDPPKTLDDVRKLIQRPFLNDEVIPTEPEKINNEKTINKLIVGTGEHKPQEERGNIMYKPLRMRVM